MRVMSHERENETRTRKKGRKREGGEEGNQPFVVLQFYKSVAVIIIILFRSPLLSSSSCYASYGAVHI